MPYPHPLDLEPRDETLEDRDARETRLEIKRLQNQGRLIEDYDRQRGTFPEDSDY